MLKKALILLSCIVVTLIIWFIGLEVVYAHILAFISNVLLGMSGSEAHIAIEQHNGVHSFAAHTLYDGREARFGQQFHTLLYPTIMMLAWHGFTAIIRGWKQSLSSAKWNMGLFMAVQVLFLLLLTNIMSDTATFFYYLLHDGFYVVALVIIIVDHLRNPVFGLP